MFLEREHFIMHLRSTAEYEDDTVITSPHHCSAEEIGFEKSDIGVAM